MASPFDLYQQQQFDGLDPNKFNKDYYAELQKSLFANTLKDQLAGLKENYEKEQTLQENNKLAAESARKQLEELSGKTQNYLDALKEAENAVNSTRNMINSYYGERDKAQSSYNNYKSRYAAYANAQQTVTNEMNNLIKTRGGGRVTNLRGADLNRYLQLGSLLKSYNKYRAEASKGMGNSRQIIASWNRAISDQTKNVLTPREQTLTKTNADLTNHKNTLAQISSQISQLADSTGTSSKAAEKAMTDAQALQDKITNYQTRSEPLKALESKIEGDYAAATKASAEELKKIAANNLDPVSQRNAQNLLNQRAEQIAKTYGKDVNQVKQEMSAAVGPLQGQQFASQEEFNKFMGIEAAKQAELQDPGALNNLQEQIMPQPAPAAGSPQQATIQPVGELQPIAQPALTNTPPQPIQPPQTQQQVPQVQQNQAQVQTSGMPANPAPPQQTNAPQQSAVQQESGMPKPPAPQPQATFGAINPYVRQGMASQIRQGFQNAMRIKATPQPRQPKPAADPMEERRKAVAAQAMGGAQQPTSVSQRPQTKPFGSNQNIQTKTQQNTVNSGVGRRQPR